MEALTRLVADSFARHGLDHPVDPRRLQWSRWFRCDSPHSLLVVPSKPGIFALAEEIMDLGSIATLGAGKTNLETSKTHVGTAALGCPAEQSSAAASAVPPLAASTDLEGHDFSSDPALSKRSAPKGAVNTAEASTRRMLAVLQFSEDDDMAFTLDRMFTRINPMRDRLSSGRCFLRFAVIEDRDQRRSICTALNQWMLTSAGKATGVPADFQSSLELPTARVGRTLLSDSADTISKPALAPPPKPDSQPAAPYLASGAAKNLHCPHLLPSGF